MKRPLIAVINVDGAIRQAIQQALSGAFPLAFISEQVSREQLANSRAFLLLVGDSPDRPGRYLLKRLRRAFPQTPLVFLSDTLDLPTRQTVARLERIELQPPHRIEAQLLATVHQLFRTTYPLLNNAYAHVLPFSFPFCHALRAGPRLKHLHKICQSVPILPAVQPHPAAARPPSEDAMLKARMLGTFDLAWEGQLLGRLGRKEKFLLAYLLCHAPRPIAKDRLMEQCWPERTPDCARNSLNVALHNIRKQLARLTGRKDAIQFKGDQYRLHPDLPLQADVHQFRRHYEMGLQYQQEEQFSKAAQEFEQALKHYQDDFLKEMAYENDWLESERNSLRERYLKTLDRLSIYFFEAQNFNSSIRFAQQLLEKDSCWERVHVRIMLSHEQLGDRARAVRQYHRCVEALALELNVSPGAQTRAIYERIRSGAHKHEGPAMG